LAVNLGCTEVSFFSTQIIQKNPPIREVVFMHSSTGKNALRFVYWVCIYFLYSNLPCHCM
jgi:hypothetical protein